MLGGAGGGVVFSEARHCRSLLPALQECVSSCVQLCPAAAAQPESDGIAGPVGACASSALWFPTV